MGTILVVEDEQDIMALAHVVDGLEVVGRRNQDAAGSHNRLQNHRGDGVRSFTFDDGFQIMRAGER